MQKITLHAFKNKWQQEGGGWEGVGGGGREGIHSFLSYDRGGWRGEGGGGREEGCIWVR